jgi:hypothetical protein
MSLGTNAPNVLGTAAAGVLAGASTPPAANPSAITTAIDLVLIAKVPLPRVVLQADRGSFGFARSLQSSLTSLNRSPKPISSWISRRASTTTCEV